ncbi:MAG: 1-acyl-sn-glycerol-3-phosphate acyltransferase [Rhodospirillales bacterium]|nr:1-acyl-sn-glycerol-3-phosphate acyltransferase [Rhodospirillales bacterium]
MRTIGSFLFGAFLFGWTAILCVAYLPLLLVPRLAFIGAVRLWIRSVLGALRLFCRLDHEFRGLERLPQGPFIIAAKHQSAWDTFIFSLLVPDPCFILKRELTWIPLFGVYLIKHGMIAVDRKAGAKALKKMLKDADRALARGSTLVIFPEGTRVAPGDSKPYQPGVAALYGSAGVPVVPVALNSGLYWGRRQFLKKPGRIVLEVLEPILPGQDRKAFQTQLKERLETATQRLIAEAKG